MLGVQCISRDDASLDQGRREILRDDGEFILLLPGHLLFENHPRLGFIERQLMHLHLIGRRMAQCATQRLAIEGQMYLPPLFPLSHQATRFVPTSFRRPNAGEPVVHHLGHLLGLHGP